MRQFLSFFHRNDRLLQAPRTFESSPRKDWGLAIHRGNNALCRGFFSDPPRPLGVHFASEGPFFSTEAVIRASVRQGVNNVLSKKREKPDTRQANFY